ncbi:hypothetical protein MAR_002059, partial [Mya arenaria]
MGIPGADLVHQEHLMIEETVFAITAQFVKTQDAANVLTGLSLLMELDRHDEILPCTTENDRVCTKNSQMDSAQSEVISIETEVADNDEFNTHTRLVLVATCTTILFAFLIVLLAWTLQTYRHFADRRLHDMWIYGKGGVSVIGKSNDVNGMYPIVFKDELL